ncbi:MAG: autoinducer binding domain-containing protein [Ahrensia sp.]|nr:autoinducer binding domain-containing protein [Ahrensia sp.]
MRIFHAPKFTQGYFGYRFPPELLDIFKEARDATSAKNISFWAPDDTNLKNPITGDFIIATTYPLWWIQEYAMKGYSSIDPVITDCLYSNAALFIDYTKNMDADNNRFYTAVLKSGVGEIGLSIPCHFSNEHRSVTTFTFSSSQNASKINSAENIKICRTFAHRIAEFLLARKGGFKAASKLNDRELQILKLIASGANYADIASAIELSRWTVIAHAKSMRTRLGVKNNAEAINIALKSELI